MKKLIIMGIPYHGNIGDQAIAIAEEQILKKYFPEYDINLMSEDNLDICSERAKKYINEETIILLHGGGNIGDTYSRPERGRRKVIQLYPNNKIIIFPQTAYFSNTENGKKELKISKQIYNAHKDLTIMAREQKSYEFMKKHFYNNKIYLTPDIVMSMEKKANKERNGALLLFRNDTEKVLDNNEVEKITQIIRKKYGSCTFSDMSLGHLDIHNIGGKYRKQIVDSKFNEFQTSKVVITDRLHGMIFSAISQTPCVALGNFNHKIEMSYQWLKDLGYIEYCNDISNIEEKINKVTSSNKPCYDSSFANNIIAKILKDEIKNIEKE